MPSQFIQKCVSVYNSLNRNDWLNGLLLAVFAAAIGALGQNLEAVFLGGADIDFSRLHWPTRPEWILACKAGFAAGAAYVIRKYKSGPKKAPAS